MVERTEDTLWSSQVRQLWSRLNVLRMPRQHTSFVRCFFQCVSRISTWWYSASIHLLLLVSNLRDLDRIVASDRRNVVKLRGRT